MFPVFLALGLVEFFVDRGDSKVGLVLPRSTWPSILPRLLWQSAWREGSWPCWAAMASTLRRHGLWEREQGFGGQKWRVDISWLSALYTGSLNVYSRRRSRGLFLCVRPSRVAIRLEWWRDNGETARPNQIPDVQLQLPSTSLCLLEGNG